MRNWTSDLRIPRSDALPLSHRDSTVSEVYYEVHIRRVLHTARISSVDSVMFGNRIREMESFDLGKEKEKDIFRLFTNWSFISNVPQKSNLTNLFPPTPPQHPPPPNNVETYTKSEPRGINRFSIFL